LAAGTKVWPELDDLVTSDAAITCKPSPSLVILVVSLDHVPIGLDQRSKMDECQRWPAGEAQMRGKPEGRFCLHQRLAASSCWRSLHLRGESTWRDKLLKGSDYLAVFPLRYWCVSVYPKNQRFWHFNNGKIKNESVCA